MGSAQSHWNIQRISHASTVSSAFSKEDPRRNLPPTLVFLPTHHLRIALHRNIHGIAPSLQIVYSSTLLVAPRLHSGQAAS